MRLTKAEYYKARKSAAESMERFNRLACIHFAEVLRTHDQYERLFRELGMNPEQLIPKDYFEIVYRVLSMGKVEDRATLILGNAAAIEKLVKRVMAERGFKDERNRWVEI